MSRLWITKSAESASANTSKTKSGKASALTVRFHFQETQQKEYSWELKSQNARSLRDFAPSSMIERTISELDRINLETWRLNTTGELLSVDDILERYGSQVSSIFGFPPLPEKNEEMLQNRRKSIPIRFIETQRLLNAKRGMNPREYGNAPNISPTVPMYAEELAELIKMKLAESTALSQSLDRTFPRRLVSSASKKSDVSEIELRNKLAILEEKRANLMATGLVDKDDNDAVQVTDRIDGNTRSVLSVYIEDVEKKLGVFDEIANKINLLTKIINKRFLYKKMTISRKDGFIFTASNGSELSLENLSSGEQHELVLFYELLFKVPSGSLILIDEPEISLHVVWQEQFIKDVQEITRLANVDVIIATHSPDIIDGQRDLMVQLKGPEDDFGIK